MLALAALPVSAQDASKEAIPSKRAIYDQLQARQFAAAEQSARAYLHSVPNDCSVRTMLGLALRGEDKSDAAFEQFRKASTICPASLAPLEGAAEIAYQQHRPEARQLLDQLIANQPQNPVAHAMLGSLDARDGNCSDAVAQYADALPVVQRSALALRQYAGCLLQLGRPADAVNAFTDLLALEDTPASREALAQAQLDSGHPDAALATLQPLLNAVGPDGHALLTGAQAAEAANNTPQAIAWLRQAIQAQPKEVENYLYFAELSFTHGSYQIGEDFINLGLQQLPGNARLLVARGVMEVQLGKLDAALKDFEEAHRRAPRLSFAEDAMGILFSQKHDSSAALAFFEQMSRESPKDALMQYLYAEALSQDQKSYGAQSEKALATAQRAVALDPSYRPARDLLCMLLLRHGDLDAVVREANKATQQDPYDEVALYQALLAERKLKHNDQVPDLVRRLQEAKKHNQVAGTKYILEEHVTQSQEK